MNRYLILLALWMLSLLAIGFWQNKSGRNAIEAKLTNSYQEALQGQQRQRQDLEETVKNYEKELSHVTSEKNIALSNLKLGKLQLRDQGLPSPSNSASSPGTAGDTGTKGKRLSEQTATFLIGLASDADAVADQLRACQKALGSFSHP